MKHIKDFEGLYHANEDGTIRGLKLNRLLKPQFSENGYLHVTLSKNGKRVTRNVHRLIAETFIPNPLNLPQVNHINGDKTDCAVSNLEWSSAKDNTNHADNTGLRNIKGESHGMAKLSEAQVLEIRALQDKMLGTEIAKLYGVGKDCIYHIFRNTSWIFGLKLDF